MLSHEADPVPALPPAGIVHIQQADGAQSCLVFREVPAEQQGSRLSDPPCAIAEQPSHKENASKGTHLHSKVGELLNYLPKDGFAVWEQSRKEDIYARYLSKIEQGNVIALIACSQVQSSCSAYFVEQSSQVLCVFASEVPQHF